VNETGSVNGVWKWLAALLAAILLAGLPGIIQLYRAPTKAEVEFIRERQNQVLVRLAQIDERITINRELILEIKRELELHQQQQTGLQR
jgi:hypothetical protein